MGGSRPRQGQTGDGSLSTPAGPRTSHRRQELPYPQPPQLWNDWSLGGGGHRGARSPELRAGPQLAYGALAPRAQRQGHPPAHTHPGPSGLSRGGPQAQDEGGHPTCSPTLHPLLEPCLGPLGMSWEPGPVLAQRGCTLCPVTPCSASLGGARSSGGEGEEGGVGAGVKRPLFLYWPGCHFWSRSPSWRRRSPVIFVHPSSSHWEQPPAAGRAAGGGGGQGYVLSCRPL